MEIETERVCNKCGTSKPINSFAPYGICNGYLKKGRRITCNSCRARQTQEYRKANPEKYFWDTRKNKLAKKYGISAEQYQNMFDDQQGRCAICGIHNDEIKDRPARYILSVDHCHDTGQVRGLLCPRCNKGIGQFQDNPDIVSNAAEYLRRAS